MNPYESPKLLDEYLLFHYGTAEEILPWDFGPATALNFPVRTVEALDWERLSDNSRALDLGCAVGRSSFELSRHCAEVIGIDFSQSFVDAAERIRQEGEHSYLRLEEGRDKTTQMASLPEGAHPECIQFEQGDAMKLRPDLGAFDVVHAANLLCRLTEPQAFLAQLPALVRPGGQLFMTTPCTWLEEYTPPQNWPAGSTLEYLQSHLAESFEFEATVELPFLIREHRRKYQWTVAQGSRWLRR